MKTRIAILATLLLTLAGCGGQAAAPSAAQTTPAQTPPAQTSSEEAVTAKSPEEKDAAQQSVTVEDSRPVDEESTGEENTMRLMIGEKEVPVAWEENESVKALQDLCPLTIQMSMYGGFEQVGPIGQNIVRADEQTVTDSGDIVLYSGNQIVIFYGSNSWAYTRLGHIDQSDQEMQDLLSGGDVTITLK